MKQGKTVLTAVCVISAIFSFACCSSVPSAESSVNASSAVSASSTSSADQSSYFPMDIGRRWTYEIVIGKAEPMVCERMYVRNDGNSFSFYRTENIHAPEGENYMLSMGVKGYYGGQARSVEIEILQDELGLFRFVDETIWSRVDLGLKSSQNGILAFTYYAADELKAHYPQIESTGQCTSERHIFIWGGGGIVQEDIDSLFFSGIEYDVPGYEKTPCCHFIRKVYSDKSAGSTVFTEDSWYAPEIGLVLFEQRVGEEISMTWRLLE